MDLGFRIWGFRRVPSKVKTVRGLRLLLLLLLQALLLLLRLARRSAAARGRESGGWGFRV